MERTKEAANYVVDKWNSKNINKADKFEEALKCYKKSLERTHKQYKEKVKELKSFIKEKLIISEFHKEKLLTKIKNIFGGI